MKEKLATVLEEVMGLLLTCGLVRRADWFRSKLEIIREKSAESDLIRAAIEEIRGRIAGMGSFTDLPLDPTVESGLTREEARQKQWQLAAELDEITGVMLGLKK